ncbi:hypothetical protein V7O66_07965 [Methanolobus sp. ZRKC3]|uniref:hypothetical protein n=1 Tax=Methanolobus sp. ZRKC3 TaxID=3125786 RepID=UPI003247A78D
MEIHLAENNNLLAAAQVLLAPVVDKNAAVVEQAAEKLAVEQAMIALAAELKNMKKIVMKQTKVRCVADSHQLVNL